MTNILLCSGLHSNFVSGGSASVVRLSRFARWAGGVLFTLLVFGARELPATTTYYSTGSADVNTLTHWVTARDGTGVSPVDFTSGDVFVIQNGHSMTTTAAWSVSGGGNTVQIEPGGMLSATYIVATTTFQIEDDGTYIHNAASGSANGSTTDIPGSTSRSFGASSTVEMRKWANGGTTPVALPAGVAWGNLKINVASLGGDWNLAGGLTTVNGSLTIAVTGGKSLLLTGTGGAGYTLRIIGDLNIIGGTLDTLYAGSVANEIDLGGNFRQTGGTFIHSGTSSPAALLFTGGSSTASFSYSGGTFNANRVNITVDTGKSVTLNNNLDSGTTPARTFTVKGTLLCGTSILKGSAQFFLNSGATLGIGDPNGITSGKTLSGNIQTDGSTGQARTFDPGANYLYNGAAGAQATGNGLPATVSKLTINNANGVSLSGSVVVNGTLTFTSGRLKTGVSTLSLGTAATVSGAGGGTGWVVGNLTKNFAVGQNQSITFDLGDDSASSYTPAALANMGVSTAGTLAATVIANTEPNLASASGISTSKYAKRYWTVTPGGGFTLGGANPIFAMTATFLPGDIQNGANPNSFIMRKDNSGTWTAPSGGSATPTATTGTGFGSFSSFAVGEPACTPAAATVRSADAATICAGQPVTVHADLAGQGPWTVVWFDGTTTATHSGVGGTGTTGSDSITANPTSTRTYTVTSVSDAGGCSSVAGTGAAQVTVNALPGGVADILSTPTNTPATVSAAKLKANDTGSSLQITAVTAGTGSHHGSVSLSGTDGMVTYTPETDYGGSDTFSYSLSNDQGCSVEVTVNVAVGAGSGISANVLYAGIADGHFVARFAGIPGYTYTVEYTDGLAPDCLWAKLGSNNYEAPGTGDPHPYGIGVFQVTDPMGSANRYYRTVWPAY